LKCTQNFDSAVDIMVNMLRVNSQCLSNIDYFRPDIFTSI